LPTAPVPVEADKRNCGHDGVPESLVGS
jgi:hypothetical protein